MLSDLFLEALPVWRKLEEAALAGNGPDAIFGLARAYMEMGWWAEAEAMHSFAEEAGVMNELLEGLFEMAEERKALMAALEQYEKRLNIDFEGGKEPGSFAGAVAELGEKTEAATGRRLLLPGAICSSTGVQWLGDEQGLGIRSGQNGFSYGILYAREIQAGETLLDDLKPFL